MDDQGRLIIPAKDENSKGFVGETFAESGVAEEMCNRHERRKAAKLARLKELMTND